MNESQDRNPVEVLADEFVERFRRGERPALSEYTNAYPDLAEEIRELFPLVVEMEDARSSDDSESSVATPKTPELMQQLGDYRIIREIGRGGMGFVYEAEQVSLGRHVALKVLPSELLENPTQRSRFEREAKAAAKLHHTNIVPVFGVGEDEGQVYYVMQFIQGLALDLVLKELKRLTAKSDSSTSILPTGELQLGRRELSAEDVAQSLMTGSFQPPVAGAGSLMDEKHEVDETLIQRANASAVPSSTANEATSTGRLSDTFLDSNSSVLLPGGGSGQSHKSHKKQTYWQSVAQTGVQVAAALEYAHRQGVLHRDIKPANLLLDIHGTVWITDFGLAKLEDERDLTQTGDILGTLRYMAPETFKGKADARSEIYSLGLTLYELLALRPAFDQTNRSTLVDHVMKAQIEPLAKLNSEIPIDLQTIVHKTVDREPAHRYQTAQELVDDLQRFIDDEPIKARRISLPERFMRWSRHNRGIAASLLTVALLITVLAVGSMIAAGYFRSLSRRLNNTVADLTKAKSELEAAGEETERKATENFQLAQEAETARRHSVTTLADMHTERGFLAGRSGDAGTSALWFANAAFLTPHDTSRQAANRLRARNWLMETSIPTALLDFPNGEFRRVAFQPNGHLLLTLNTAGLRIWDWELEQSLSWPEPLANVTDAGWSPDGREIALAFESGDIQIHEHSSGLLIRRFKFPGRVKTILWSPDDQHIAVAGSRVQVWNVVVEPRLEHDWPHAQQVYALRFNQAGDRLVTACEDNRARLFAVRGPSDLPAPLFAAVEHSPYRPTAPVFCDGARKLVTVSKKSKPRWWEVGTGTEVTPELNVANERFHRDLASSPDGRWVAIAGDSCLVWNVDGESFVLKHSNAVHDVAFAPNNQRLLTTCLDGKARVWSLPPSGHSLQALPQLETFRTGEFSANGRFIAVSSFRDVVVWQLPHPDEVVGHIQDWDEPRRRPMPSFDGRLGTPGAWHETPFSSLAKGGKTLTVVAMDDGRPAGPTIALNGTLVDSCLCADNRRVAAACIKDQSGILSVYDVPTGELVFPTLALPDLPISVSARPDESQIAVLCKGGELLVFDTIDGSQVLELYHEGWAGNRPSARVEFSPDGSAMITVTPQDKVVVRDADTGRLRFPIIQPVVEGGPCRTIAVSLDSQLLATAVTGKNVVQVWNLVTGKPASPALPHPGDFYGIFAVEFSPDSRWILTGHKDGRMRLWDWKAGKLVIPPMQHPDEIYDVKFTSNGRHALAAVRRGTVHLWDLTTGKLAAAPVRYPLDPLLLDDSTIALGIAGTRVIAGAGGYPVIDLSVLLQEPTNSVEGLTTLAELSTNRKLQLGELSTLERSEWEERWTRHEQVRFHPEAAAEALARKLDESPDAATRHMIAARAVRFELLEQLVRLRPDIPQLHQALARKHARQGDETTAKHHYKIASTALERQLVERPNDSALALELARLMLDRARPSWTALETLQMQSESGATLTKLPDGSLLAGSGDFAVDAYTINCRCRLRRITAILLEVLPNPSLPRRGPGLAIDGNFHLTELRASWQSASGESIPLAFRSATADYVRAFDKHTSPTDAPSGVIDGDQTTRWDVSGKTRTPHSLVLQLADPIDLAESDQILIQLDFRDSSWKNHRLGCFRLSATDEDNAFSHEQIRFAVSGSTTMSGPTSLAAAYLASEQAGMALEILQASTIGIKAIDEGERLLLVARAHRELGQQAAAGEACEALIDWLKSTTLPRILHPLLESVLIEADVLDRGQVRELLIASTIEFELNRLTSEIESGTESVANYQARARYFAQIGRWRDSADDFLKAVKLDRQSRHPWLQVAPVLLFAGDEHTYQATCQDMVEQFRGTDQPDVADVVCKVALLKPQTVELSDLPIETLRDATSDPAWAHYRNWFIACCALISYREGDPQQAIKWAGKLQGPMRHAEALATVVRAMAEHQLGKTEQARATLAKTESVIPARLRTLGTGEYNGPLPVSSAIIHHDWLIPEILRREAEALVNVEP